MMSFQDLCNEGDYSIHELKLYFSTPLDISHLQCEIR